MSVARRISLLPVLVSLLGCASQTQSASISTGRREGAGGTTKKNGDTNVHLLSWTMRNVADLTKSCTPYPLAIAVSQKFARARREKMQISTVRKVFAEVLNFIA